jgi:pimeloyl-ACP methyl ester carboxylesterase
VRYGWTTTRDGTRLAHQVDGPDDGPPLLLLPGQANSHHWWDRIRQEYAATYRTITFDYRGTGHSHAPPGTLVTGQVWSTRLFAADAAAVLDHLGHDTVKVYGTSLGGRVAQMLAIHHPEPGAEAVPGEEGEDRGDGEQRGREHPRRREQGAQPGPLVVRPALLLGALRLDRAVQAVRRLHPLGLGHPAVSAQPHGRLREQPDADREEHDHGEIRDGVHRAPAFVGSTQRPRTAAREPPIGTPDIMIVATADRLRTFTNSAVSAFADGTRPPRPSPARNRKRPNTSGFGAKAQRAVKSENQSVDQRIVRRRPSRSASAPAPSAPASMPAKARLPMNPAADADRSQPGSSCSSGSVVP